MDTSTYQVYHLVVPATEKKKIQQNCYFDRSKVMGKGLSFTTHKTGTIKECVEKSPSK